MRTGSGNFSRPGLAKQDNDLILISDQEAVDAFEANFDSIWTRPRTSTRSNTPEPKPASLSNLRLRGAVPTPLGKPKRRKTLITLIKTVSVELPTAAMAGPAAPSDPRELRQPATAISLGQTARPRTDFRNPGGVARSPSDRRKNQNEGLPHRLLPQFPFCLLRYQADIDCASP